MPKQPTPPRINKIPVRGPWHDYYFKSSFQTSAQLGHLLRLAFNDEQLALFDLDTLRIESSHHPGADDLSEKISDRVVSVELKQEKRVDVHLLIEHKSHPDAKVSHQLLDYVTRLLKQGISSVIPIVFYHGRQDWRPAPTFAAGQYAGYPGEYRRLFNDVLLHFGLFFINASARSLHARLQQLPPEVALVLDIMVNIVDADAPRYVEWLRRAARLEQSVRGPFIGRLKDYFWKQRPSITIQSVRELLWAAGPGDVLMQEAIDIWEKYQPDSGREMWDLAVEQGVIQGLEEGLGKGLQQGLDKGLEKGARDARSSIAQSMIDEGYDDREIQKLTQLSWQEIAQLKNGSGLIQ